MSNLLEYFDRVFVINLPTRQDRRHEIAFQLQSIGLELNKGNVMLFPAVRPDSPDGFPSVGARGCFLSHLGILRTALEDRLARILVLEDDLDFEPDFFSRAPGVIAAMKSTDWSLFYGGCRMDAVAREKISDGLIVVTPDDQIATTHFIGLTGEAIRLAVPYFESMLARPAGHPEGGPMHVDGAYNWLRRAHPDLKTLVATPELGHQRPSRTDIHDLKWFDSMPVVRNAASALRRLKRSFR